MLRIIRDCFYRKAKLNTPVQKQQTSTPKLVSAPITPLIIDEDNNDDDNDNFELNSNVGTDELVQVFENLDEFEESLKMLQKTRNKERFLKSSVLKTKDKLILNSITILITIITSILIRFQFNVYPFWSTSVYLNVLAIGLICFVSYIYYRSLPLNLHNLNQKIYIVFQRLKYLFSKIQLDIWNTISLILIVGTIISFESHLLYLIIPSFILWFVNMDTTKENRSTALGPYETSAKKLETSVNLKLGDIEGELDKLIMSSVRQQNLNCKLEETISHSLIELRSEFLVYKEENETKLKKIQLLIVDLNLKFNRMSEHWVKRLIKDILISTLSEHQVDLLRQSKNNLTSFVRTFADFIRMVKGDVRKARRRRKRSLLL